MNSTKANVIAGTVAIIMVLAVISGSFYYIHYQLSPENLSNNADLTDAGNPTDVNAPKPGTPEAFISNARKASDSMDLDTQIANAKALVASGQDTENANILLAHSLLTKGSVTFEENTYADQAITILNSVLQNDPKNVEAISILGYAYEIKQDYKKAFEYYNKALAINPSDAATLSRRGHAYDLTGDLTKAEADYIASYKLDTGDDTNLMNLTRLYYNQGQESNVMYYGDQTLSVTNNSYIKSVIHTIFGLAAKNDSEYDQALKEYSQAIQLAPKYQDPYQRRAYLYIIEAMQPDVSAEQKTHLFGLASSDLDSALAIHSGSSYATEMKGLIASASGDQKTALGYYNKALSMVDSDITLSVTDKATSKENINTYIKISHELQK